jgi:hypothetical protein
LEPLLLRAGLCIWIEGAIAAYATGEAELKTKEKVGIRERERQREKN